MAQRYSEEGLLQELRELADELEKIPTTADMDDHCEPMAATYYEYFESWSDAVERAGLDSSNLILPAVTISNLGAVKRPLSNGYSRVPRIGFHVITAGSISSRPPSDAEFLDALEDLAGRTRGAADHA